MKYVCKSNCVVSWYSSSKGAPFIKYNLWWYQHNSKDYYYILRYSEDWSNMNTLNVWYHWNDTEYYPMSILQYNKTCALYVNVVCLKAGGLKRYVKHSEGY